MDSSSIFNTPPLCIMASLLFGMVVLGASANPMHKPSNMPLATAESVAMSSEGLAEIDKLFNDKIDAGLIQGGVTIVARQGKVVHFSTHGKMDVDNDRAMEPDTSFLMASSSKPLYAAAAMVLVDEGLISLEEPVSKYIPRFAEIKVAIPLKSSKDVYSKGKGKISDNYRLVSADKSVTIYHLLTHTSGIPWFSLSTLAKKSSKKGSDDLADRVDRIASSPLVFQPGTQWGYSNDALDVIGRVIEVASGMRLDEFMSEKLFKPLEMNNTYFGLPKSKASKRMVLRGKYQKEALDKYFESKGVASTAEDYLHFNQMLLNEGELFGRRVLSQESVRMISADHVGDLFSRMDKGPTGMGFGFMVSVTLDPVAANNSRGKGSFGWGGMGGTSSWADPENELVGVLMLQQEHGDGFAEAINESINR
ncbi:MAG: serine hydrolase domain-containing protein [Candidatus Azotimanducaceae bacterium]|uniref:Class A beta-lactamase-related serine hydrolase n=1 Tax=OM182 bacterium TaxID=2510334 RepID=A0A520RZN9_9GAMM|nr:hypothetical protein [Gammaproteobacteria bacterium]RZO75700.1 MAG: class A beta-lactamase-related serine hydrolase [OM182 bacterium]